MKIVIMIECKDGKLRQVIIPKDTNHILMDVLTLNNGKIRVLDKPIEGIEIE